MEDYLKTLLSIKCLAFPPFVINYDAIERRHVYHPVKPKLIARAFEKLLKLKPCHF
jgi:hypothetical protein